MLGDDPRIIEIDDFIHPQPFRFVPSDGEIFIGREGHIKIAEDDRYMHRRLLSVYYQSGNWKIANIGGRIIVNLILPAGTGHSGRPLNPHNVEILPVGTTSVECTLNRVRYGVDLRVIGKRDPVPERLAVGGKATAGEVTFTSEQRELIFHLTDRLRRDPSTPAERIPSVRELAELLGCSEKAVNSRIERICRAYEQIGIPIGKPQREKLANYLVQCGIAEDVSHRR